MSNKLLKQVACGVLVCTFSSLCISIQVVSGVINTTGLFGISGTIMNEYIQTLVKESYVSFMVLVMSILTSTKIRVMGLPSDIENLYNKRHQILMSNHLIYTDWIYIWFVYWFFDKSHTLVFFLANKFKYIPILGIGMQFFNFVFLQRNWSKDHKILHDAFNFFKKNSNQDASFIIFPEGTVLCDSTLEVCQKYANKENEQDKTEKRKIKVNKNTLIPKSRGLYTILQEMFYIDTLIDFTIHYHPFSSGVNKYPYDLYPLDKILFEDKGPEKIDIVVKSYHRSDVPGINSQEPRDDSIDYNNFNNWLLDNFTEKCRDIDQNIDPDSDFIFHIIDIVPKIGDYANLLLICGIAWYISIPCIRFAVGYLWVILWNVTFVLWNGGWNGNWDLQTILKI